MENPATGLKIRILHYFVKKTFLENYFKKHVLTFQFCEISEKFEKKRLSIDQEGRGI